MLAVLFGTRRDWDKINTTVVAVAYKISSFAVQKKLLSSSSPYNHSIREHPPAYEICKQKPLKSLFKREHTMQQHP